MSKTPFATKRDIERIIVTMATKHDVQEVLNEVRTLTSLTRQSITNNDGLATRITHVHEEHLALSAQVDRHEKFLKKLTPLIRSKKKAA